MSRKASPLNGTCAVCRTNNVSVQYKVAWSPCKTGQCLVVRIVID